jgi:hypothetical protein
MTAARATRLTGASNVLELLAFAEQSGVEIRSGLLPREEEQARRATDLIRRLLAEADSAVSRQPEHTSPAE